MAASKMDKPSSVNDELVATLSPAVAGEQDWLSLARSVAQGAAEILAACVSESDPEQMLRRMLGVLRDHIPFDTLSYSEYSYGSGDSSDPIFVQSRFAGIEDLESNVSPSKIPNLIAEFPMSTARNITMGKRASV